MRRLTSFIAVFIIVGIMSALAVVSQPGLPSLRCSLDGSRIQPRYEVIIIRKDTVPKIFSCILNAQIWFRENSGQVSSILVTDESTGKKIKAEQAFCVASNVITTPHTGNNIHVFGKKSSAILHARLFQGELVENPFRAQEKNPVQIVKSRPDSTGGFNFLFSSSRNPLSLPTKTALMRERNSHCLSQIYPARLSNGYLSPPDKPPRNVA